MIDLEKLTGILFPYVMDDDRCDWKWRKKPAPPIDKPCSDTCSCWEYTRHAVLEVLKELDRPARQGVRKGPPTTS